MIFILFSFRINFYSFKILIKKLSDNLYETLDACLLLETINEDIFKNFCKMFNSKILDIIEEYWGKNFSYLSVIIFNNIK
jgi:hypothetical protein